MELQTPTECDVLNPTLYEKLRQVYKRVNVYSRGDYGEFSYETPSIFTKNNKTDVSMRYVRTQHQERGVGTFRE